MIKTCERCHREFFEEDRPMTPMEELGDLFLSSGQNGENSSLCPACQKSLAMNLLLINRRIISTKRYFLFPPWISPPQIEACSVSHFALQRQKTEIPMSTENHGMFFLGRNGSEIRTVWFVRPFDTRRATGRSRLPSWRCTAPWRRAGQG
jgi:hypothetical protein